MKITIDIPQKTLQQLKSVTNSNNEEDAIAKAIEFTIDRY